MKFALPPLSKKDWVIVVLVFLVTLLSSELISTIDETTLEAPGMTPWYWMPFGLVGFLLFLIVNTPMVSIVHGINWLSNPSGMGNYLISYDAYFYVAPILSSLFYAFITMVMLDPRGRKK